jgi:hypothetical protein
MEGAREAEKENDDDHTQQQAFSAALSIRRLALENRCSIDVCFRISLMKIPNVVS